MLNQHFSSIHVREEELANGSFFIVFPGDQLGWLFSKKEGGNTEQQLSRNSNHTVVSSCFHPFFITCHSRKSSYNDDINTLHSLSKMCLSFQVKLYNSRDGDERFYKLFHLIYFVKSDFFAIFDELMCFYKL